MLSSLAQNQHILSWSCVLTCGGETWWFNCCLNNGGKKRVLIQVTSRKILSEREVASQPVPQITQGKGDSASLQPEWVFRNCTFCPKQPGLINACPWRAAHLTSRVPLYHLVTLTYTRKIPLLLVCVAKSLLSATLQPAFPSQLCTLPSRLLGQCFPSPWDSVFLSLLRCCYSYASYSSSLAPAHPNRLSVLGSHGQWLPPVRESAFFPHFRSILVIAFGLCNKSSCAHKKLAMQPLPQPMHTPNNTDSKQWQPAEGLSMSWWKQYGSCGKSIMGRTSCCTAEDVQERSGNSGCFSSQLSAMGIALLFPSVSLFYFSLAYVFPSFSQLETK